jgi:hypothetical protein
MKLILLCLISISLYSGDLSNIVDRNQKNIDKFKKSDFVETMYTGNDFISKKDFKKINQKIKQNEKDLKGPFYFILYFFSESVPDNSILDILNEVGILQNNGFNVMSKQYLVGPPKDFKAYMFKMKDIINNKEKNKEAKKHITDNFHLKFGPDFFKYFSLNKVPAIALATCKSMVPDTKTCKFEYLIKGDTTLTNFFAKISLKDKKYEIYHKFLIANKIYGDKK